MYEELFDSSFEKSHQSAMPLFVAPSFTDSTPQPMLLVNVG